MKKTTLCLACLTLLYFPAVTLAQGWTGNINGFIGMKSLDEDDWMPVEDQLEFGVTLDFAPDTWPINLALDVFHSQDEDSALGIDIDGETTELNLGVRKHLDDGIGGVFFGGGLAYVDAEFSGTANGVSVSASDNAVGGWLDLGFLWRPAPSFNVGVDIRYSFAEITLFDIDGEAGGLHFGLLAGAHW